MGFSRFAENMSPDPIIPIPSPNRTEILNITEDYQYQTNQVLETHITDQVHFPLFPLGILIILVTLSGISGNLVSAHVLLRKRLRSSSYSVLTLALTLVDTIYLLTKLLRYGFDSFFTHFEIFTNYTNVFLPIFGPYLRPLTFTAHTASTYLTLTIAFDRYLIIAWPNAARHCCTTKQARRSAMVVILFAILYNVPRWYEFHTKTVLSQMDVNETVSEGSDGHANFGNENEYLYEMVISELRTNQKYKVYYIFWAYFIIMFFLPFVTLAILNFFIWKGLNSIGKSGLTQTYTQSRDTSFSTMLVGVVVVFLLCNLDYLVLDFLDYFGIYYSPLWNYVGNFLLTVNSAVNFLIYCLCGRKFREELTTVFQQRWERIQSCSWIFRCYDFVEECDCNCVGGHVPVQSQDLVTTGVWMKAIPARETTFGNGSYVWR